MNKEKKIVNLTIAPITKSMRDHGVYNLSTTDRIRLENLLDLPDNPSKHDIFSKSRKISELAKGEGAYQALINPPVFMASSLEYHLHKRDIDPLYPITNIQKYKEESQQVDGVPFVQCKFELSDTVEPPPFSKD